MAIERLPGQIAVDLQEYLGSWGRFDWQHANCAHFASGWVGVDLTDVPMPTALLGVRKTLRALKASSFEQAVTMRLGQPMPATMAQLGDIVMSGPMLGICNGRLFAVPREDGEGVVFIPMTQAEVAWRVG
jgi:hypothetical protein